MRFLETPLLALALVFASCASTRSHAEVEPTIFTARAYVEADYDTVWEHLTTAAAFEDWYTCPCQRFGREPGDELIWATDEREIYRGRLLSMEYGREVSWEFRFVGFGFEEPMTPLRIEVVEHGPAVLVALEHDMTGAPQSAAIIGPVGWTKPLSRLKTLLETGESMAWPVDPRGRAE